MLYGVESVVLAALWSLWGLYNLAKLLPLKKPLRSKGKCVMVSLLEQDTEATMATNTLKRTDEHRPSVINPEEYSFVALGYQRQDDIEDCYAARENMETLRAHKAATGGTYSRHEHGGNCHVCGASAIYTVVFYHARSNTYIRTGMDCAEKLDMGDARKFRHFVAAIKDARELKAGKTKARALLEEAGLSRAWEIYANNSAPGSILHDLVVKLVKYGSLSEKQLMFLVRLVDQHDKRDEIKAQRDAEKAAALPCPSGRQKITVTVIKTEYRENNYGETLKMLAKHADGWLVWGTVPDALVLVNVQRDGYTEQRGLRRGDVVEFTAAIEPSENDSKFGFYKRPTKPRIVEVAE